MEETYSEAVFNYMIDIEKFGDPNIILKNVDGIPTK